MRINVQNWRVFLALIYRYWNSNYRGQSCSVLHENVYIITSCNYLEGAYKKQKYSIGGIIFSLL